MCTKYRRRSISGSEGDEYTGRVLRTAVIAAVAIGLLLWCVLARAADARLMLNIMICESGMNSNAIGDDGVSRGIAQFRKETFYEFAAMAIKQGKWGYKKLGRPKWMNPMQQMFLLEWGIDSGYGSRWTCYRRLK